MKKIIMLVCSSFLFSCSNENNSSSVDTCSKNTSTDTTLSANSIQVFVETGPIYIPLEGIAVQLDHNGVCRRTDSKGFVRFDGLNSNKHDIHVFGKPGFEWRSQYQIDSTNGEVIYASIDNFDSQPTPDTKTHSYININGNITNSSPDSRIIEYYISNNRRSRRGNSRQISTNNTGYKILSEFDEIVGTTVDSELWFLEQSQNAIGDEVLVDAVYIPKFTTVTTTKTGSVSVKDIAFLPAQAKPPLSQVLKFGNINFPVGLSFSGIYLNGLLKSTNIPNYYYAIVLFSRFSLPDQPKTITPSSVIEAYTTPFNFENLEFTIQATLGDLNDTSWNYYTNKYLVGTTGVTIIPKITNIPLIMPNQKGDTISWSSSPIIYKRLRLRIRSKRNESRFSWNTYLAGNMNQITLPQIPNSVKTQLVAGTDYNILLSGSYETRDNADRSIIELESFANINQWTR